VGILTNSTLMFGYVLASFHSDGIQYQARQQSQADRPAKHNPYPSKEFFHFKLLCLHLICYHVFRTTQAPVIRVHNIVNIMSIEKTKVSVIERGMKTWMAPKTVTGTLRINAAQPSQRG
jgi:hypothetical protein